MQYPESCVDLIAAAISAVLSLARDDPHRLFPNAAFGASSDKLKHDRLPGMVSLAFPCSHIMRPLHNDFRRKSLVALEFPASGSVQGESLGAPIKRLVS